MNFSIVKKLNKPAPKSAGLGLRSINGDPEAVTAVLYDPEGFDAVKAAIAALRLRHSGGISYKTHGKSLEINIVSTELPEEAGRPHMLQDAPAYGAPSARRTDAVRVLFELLGSCAFNTEDVLDVMEFARTCLEDGFEPRLKVLGTECTPDFFSMDLSADVVAGRNPETIYSVLDPICVRCGLGIIKERPDELSENA